MDSHPIVPVFWRTLLHRDRAQRAVGLSDVQCSLAADRKPSAGRIAPHRRPPLEVERVGARLGGGEEEIVREGERRAESASACRDLPAPEECAACLRTGVHKSYWLVWKNQTFSPVTALNRYMPP